MGEVKVTKVVTEVVKMSIFEYDEEREIELIRRDWGTDWNRESNSNDYFILQEAW